MLQFDILHTRTLTSFLSCRNLEEMMTYAKHNRRMKEFIVFEKEELQYLIREHKIPEINLRNFA